MEENIGDKLLELELDSRPVLERTHSSCIAASASGWIGDEKSPMTSLYDEGKLKAII